MINILAVGMGGFIGAILRYGMGHISKVIFTESMLPVGTFATNVLGAFFMGMAFDLFTKQGNMGSTAQLLVMVGILGGFTTFSSFSLETVNLMSSGRVALAAGYVISSVLFCFIGVWLGRLVI